MENINLDQLKEQGYEIGGQEYDSKNFVPQRAVNLDPKIEGTTKKIGRPTHQSLDDELQASLKILKEFHDRKQVNKVAIDKPYNTTREVIENLMVRRGTKRVRLEGTDFCVDHREKANYTFSANIARLEKELKDAKQAEIDCGIATNDPTYYVQALIKK